ncbi:hypothetical protein PDJAM_G00065380 [Pangasius djambal]|uniref:Uncharacterized protein n=1 Tax=Pangasius djambal TaxID=1691987 RepID=A0ACC5Z121_9TELE|nr:hypothetical protein [Pangasius djambal]
MHLTEHPHPPVMPVPPSQSGCSIGSDSASSSLSDIYHATESEVGDMDLSGLPEAPVDSDDEYEEDEDLEHASDTLLGRDVVRECLEKEPAERNDDDIELLLEFMHQLPAFANMTMSVRRELCTVMVFDVVEQAGTVILHDKQESTVSGIITKWKQLGTTATQPRSGRPRKITEWGQRMLRRTVRRSHQLSAESIATDLQTLCGLQISSRTVSRELQGMGFHGQAAASKPYITKCNAKCRMQW